MPWLLAIALLTIPLTGYAQPFLTCDDAADVETYILELNGVAHPETASVSGHAWIDMRDVPEGTHTAVLRVKNKWGVSAPSLPLQFTKKLPTAPSPALIQAEEQAWVGRRMGIGRTPGMRAK